MIKRLSALWTMLLCVATGVFAAKMPPLRWVAADTLTIVNRAQPDGPVWQRLDVDKYGDLTKTVRKYYRFPTGMAVRFRTDSPVLYARWTTNAEVSSVNTTLIAQKGLDLYVLEGDRWQYAGTGRPTANKSRHEWALMDNAGGAAKECLLYLPLYDTIDSLQLGVAPEAAIAAAPNTFKGKVVCVGSSITHGIGVSRPGMAYPARLERALNMEFANLGASGQCKLDSFFARIVADTQADAFLFDTFSNPSAEQITERFDEFVRIIRAAHPAVPLIFLQTLDRETTTYNSKIRKFEADKQTAARRCMAAAMATDPNIYFIDPGMPIGDDHEGTVDGVHPTDLGHERILQAILPQLRRILQRN